MKKPSLTISIIVFISLSAGAVTSQTTESCATNLNLATQLPFDTSSLQCRVVWPDQDYILRYKRAGDSLWSFILSAPNTNSYVGIGFSTNGMMVGSSAVVGWVSSGGAAVMRQYYLGGQRPALVVPNQGNLQVLGNSSAIVSQSARLYMAFQLNTAQPQSRLLYSLGRPNALPSAAAGYQLTQHQDKISTTLNYVTGQSSAQNTPYTRLRRSHGVLNMLGWGILMIVGAASARYFKKWDPLWFYSHILIQLFGFALGLAGIICGFVLNNHLNADVSKHKALGIVILVLGCLQVMAFLARPDKASKFRKYWNWYHHNVGRVLIVLSISNVFYGIHLGNEGKDWNVGYGVVLGFLLLVAIVLETRLWIKS